MVKKRAGYDAASHYDPSSMDRVADTKLEGKVSTDPEEDIFGGNGLEGSSLNTHGLDIAAMRKGGMTPSDRRVRKLAICILILVVVVGASVVIAFGVQKSKASAAGSSSTHTAGALVAPPSDLSRKCSPVAVSTKAGWDECESFCAAAECCMLPEGHWFSCKVGNEERCSAYEYSCMTLEHIEKIQDQAKQGKGVGDKPTKPVGKVEVPLPPVNIDALCASDSLLTIDGFAACEDACDRASCCNGWTSNGSNECVASKPDICAAYESCSILSATPASHPDAVSSEAKKKCNTQALTTQEGVNGCNKFCEPAMCCFAGLSTNAGSAYSGASSDCFSNKTQGWCGQYAACQGLLHVESPNGLNQNQAKDAVEEACSAGYRECMNICDPAECCFLSATEYCQSVGLGEIVCSHYESCMTLHVTEITGDYDKGVMMVKVPAPPDDLNLICTSPRSDEVKKCYRACKPAHCCDEAIEMCKVLDLEACDGYSVPCKDTWDGMADEVIVPIPPKDIANSCLMGSNTPQLSDACKNACDLAACCNKPDEECRVYNPGACETYAQYCQILWNPVEAVRLKEPPQWLKDHCGAGANSPECRAGCRESMCCGGKVACGSLIVSAALCAEYETAGCGQAWVALFNGDDADDDGISRVHIPDTLPSNLGDLCSSTDPAGMEKCDKACRPARCCDGSFKGCEPINPDACNPYNSACTDLWLLISGEVTVPPPPGDIDQYCVGGIGQSASDKKKCQEDCDAAECCNEDIEECRVANPEMCDVYQEHCRPIWGDNPFEIPPPPGNLDQLCSALSISTEAGRTACQNVCVKATCCSEPIEACKVLNPEMCGRYKACSALYDETKEEFDESVTVPVPPNTLDQICSLVSLATAGGFNDCKKTCELAKCCNLPIEECRVLNPKTCGDYAPCGTLHKKEANKFSGFVEIPTAPADITEICSSDSLLTVQGFTHCEDICDQARCCEEKVDECNVKNPAICDGYYACSFLYVDGGAFDDQDQATLMKLTEQVSDACAPSKLWNPQGLSHCQHLCNDRLCCFEKEDEYSCLQDKECVIFAACGNLVTYGYNAPPREGHSDTKNPPEPKVDKLCHGDALKTVAGINACMDMCSPYLCCFSENEGENCYSDQKEVCDRYDACLNVVKPPYAGAPAPAPAPGPPSKPTDATEPKKDKSEEEITKEYIQEACSPTSLTKSEGLSNCHSLCGPHMCCFVQLGQQSNCVDTLGKECMVYGACSILADVKDGVYTILEKDEPEVDSEVDAVNDFCSYNSFETEEGKLRCVDLCSQRSCCFIQGPGNCYETDMKWCDAFEACEITNTYNPDDGDLPNDDDDDEGYLGDDESGASVDINAIKTEISSWCMHDSLQSEVGMGSCKNACDPHSCCWDQKKQCYNKNKAECEAFEGCGQLYNFLVEKEENTPEKVCTKEAIVSPEGHDACERKCSERGCCWVDNPTGNCYEEYADWCDEFRKCMILDVDSQPQQGTSNATKVEEDHPDQLCTKDKMSTENGRDACRNKCDERACCWLGDCNERKPDWCAEYKACLILDEYKDSQQGESGGSAGSQQGTQKAEPQQGTDTKSNATKVEEDHPNQLCTADKMATENGRDACRNKCDERACCWLGNCNERKPDWCAEFKACLILDKDKDSQQGTSNGSAGSQQGTPQNELQQGNDNTEPVMLDLELERICSSAGIAQDVGEACERLCKPQSCCFAADEMYNCRDEQPVLCEEFEPCESLYRSTGGTVPVQKESDKGGSQSQTPPKVEVEEACNMHYSLDPRNCQMLCKDAKCCFTEDPSLSCRGMKSFCGEYAPCKRVFVKDSDKVGSQSQIHPKAEVEEACNSKDQRNCQVLCEDAKCCFTEDPSLSCRGMKSFCGDYSPCEKVFVT